MTLLRAILTRLNFSLAAVLIVFNISIYIHSQLQLRRMLDVVGRDVVVMIARIPPEGGVIPTLPRMEAALDYVKTLEGFKAFAAKADRGRAPNQYSYLYSYVTKNYYSIKKYNLIAGRYPRSSNEAVTGRNFEHLLGSKVMLGSRSYEIVGVLQSLEQRGWPDALVDGMILVPFQASDLIVADSYFVKFKSHEYAQAALGEIEDWLSSNGFTGIETKPLANLYGLELRQKLRNVLGGALLWGVLAVLLVAGANLAAFQLARALERVRELGVRRAVGASRRDVMREALLSSSGWAAWGLALGLPLAYALAGWFEARTGLDARPTPAAVGVTGLGLLALALASAYLPARWSAGQPPASAVRGLAASLPQKRLGLAALGLAIGVAALVVQLAVGRSADEHTRKLVGDLSSDTAVYSSFLFISSRSLTDPRGVTPLDHSDYEALLASPLAARLRAHAYVEAYSGPLAGPAGDAYTYVRAYEGPYPELAGARLRAGRWPRPGKGEAAIGQGLAERLFGRDNALGQEVRALGQIWRVVGVYAGAEEALPGNAADDQLLLPREDLGGTLPRARGEILVEKKPQAPAEVFAEIARFLTERHASPELAPVEAFTPNDLAPEVRAVLLELAAAYRLLAVVILLLAGAGLAAQTMMIAQLETRTLGIRRALGASRGRVFFELLTPLLRAALLAGLLGGGAGALVSYLVVRAQEATWALPWASLAFVVLTAPLLAALAAALPAWQAVRRPPAEAMRAE